ncbi:hypothetical protein Tco_0336578 [Tanacetum coccineum]
MDDLEKFTAKEGESLEFVYERLTTLVNIMDCNNVHPILVSINTKFLNCLQLSGADMLPWNHDPLALIAHSNASSSQSHANPSSLHSPQPYYVTHPSSVVDYEEDYQRELQGDSQEDTTDSRVDIQNKNAGYGGNGNRNVGRQNRNQAFNAGNGNDEINQMVTMLVIVQNQEFVMQIDDNANSEPSYDAKAASEDLETYAAPGRQTSKELGYGITDTWDDLEDEIIYSQDRPFLVERLCSSDKEGGGQIIRQSEIAELQAADRRRQSVISDLLKADYRRQRQLVEGTKIVKSLKTQMIELQRQQGPAKDPAEPELPEEASSSS